MSGRRARRSHDDRQQAAADEDARVKCKRDRRRRCSECGECREPFTGDFDSDGRVRIRDRAGKVEEIL